MGKRKLSRRQAWRIQKIQEERLKRAERRSNPGPDRLGPLSPEQRGRVIASYGATLDVETIAGEVWRCYLRQNIEMPVVGDQVVWQGAPDGSGVVVAVSARNTLLARPDVTGAMKPLAANVDHILVVAAPEPPFSAESLDRFLIAAEKSGIPPLIIFNKIDLLSPGERARIDGELLRYSAIGYRVIHASTRTNHGLDELLDALRERTSIFAGQSGVGKSSLVKALLPDTAIAIGALAQTSGLGRHTTSAARLYHLPSGGDIIDSPGVREFRLWPMDKRELAEGFVEFRPFLGKCRFRDCRHDEEPGCAIREAVQAGAIAPQRLASYQRIARDLTEAAPAY